MSSPPPAYPPPGYPPMAYPPSTVKPAFPHDRPRPYHQMLRTWSYEGWRSWVGIVMVLVGFILVAPVLAMPVLVVGTVLTDDSFQAMATLKPVTPFGMLYLNVALGLCILVAWFTMRVMHGMRPRWLASVMPRLRWKFLLVCLGLAVVALIAQVVVSALVPSSANDTSGGLNDFTSSEAWIAVVVLLTTPFQAAGEEYVFRGYLLQAVGSLVDKPWWKWATILLTAFLFACAHLQFAPPLFFDRFAFGIVAAWLAIETGGLEAGIALHVLNNYLAFGFALVFGDISESLNAPQASYWDILGTLAQSLVYFALAYVVARRMGLQRRTAPPQTLAPASA
jgi:uncharacterized protein